MSIKEKMKEYMRVKNEPWIPWKEYQQKVEQINDIGVTHHYAKLAMKRR